MMAMSYPLWSRKALWRKHLSTLPSQYPVAASEKLLQLEWLGENVGKLA